jgi:hypothetical protein
MAAVELNNHGYTVVDNLSKAKYPQYEFKPGEPGWSTNRRTRPQMVDGLAEAAEDGSLKINSQETVSEMRTFVEKNGKFQGESGCQDDRVIAAAIAAQLFKDAPFLAKETRTKSRGTVGFSNWANRNKHSEERDYMEIRVG